MLTIKELSLSFSGKPLFEQASFDCEPRRRYAIVGKNGAGKSSLLSILSGELIPDHGQIGLSQKSQLATLKQDHFLYEDWPLLDVVMSGRQILWDAITEKNRLLEQDHLSNQDGLRLSELEEIIMHHNGYGIEGFARRLLCGLGIPSEKHEQTLSTLSGGFKLRVLLAKTLFQNPDVLLLDEPTNHLDILSIHWLEDYLRQEFAGILLFVSHDKHFINRVATNILDIDYNTIRPYVGNYDTFLVEKASIETQKSKERKNQEAKIEQLQDFVVRMKAKASKASQAQSKLKQIERIQLVDIETSNRGAPAFDFRMERPSGKVVLTTQGIHKSFGSLSVLKNIGFECQRGEKIAITGANGLGKSTLLKIITDNVSADQGEHAWGYGVHTGYFAQDHHEQLVQTHSNLLGWLEGQCPKQSTAVIRSVLGQMLFSGDDAHKTIGSLSGGEASRLLFAQLMLQRPNVLILDEPTNHLDLESIEALTQALRDYPGTVIFVSHDRDFVRQVANRIIVLTSEGLKDITATYDEYLDASGQDFLNRMPATRTSPKEEKKQRADGAEKTPLKKTDQKREQALQAEITALEVKLNQVIQALSDPALYQGNDVARVRQLQQEKLDIEKAIEGKMSIWAEMLDPSA